MLAPAAAVARAGDAFERLRAHEETWLASRPVQARLVSAATLHGLLGDWRRHSAAWQILSVRRPEDDSLAGHVPHAVGADWPTLLAGESLARVDSSRQVVAYSDDGAVGMMAATLLGLLGYDCVSLDFGMMGWNSGALARPPWDGEADLPVDLDDRDDGTFPYPAFDDTTRDVRGLVRSRAATWLAEGRDAQVAPAEVEWMVEGRSAPPESCQVVDLRPRAAYLRGHVPRAICIPMERLLRPRSLHRLDPGRALIVYADNGQVEACAATLLSLLGYRAAAMRLGMMDWNRECVPAGRRWRGAAGYPVEKAATAR